MKPKLVFYVVVLFSITTYGYNDTDIKNAKKLYERITGIKVPSNKPELKVMADLISKKKYVEAGDVATESPDFINGQIKSFSLMLSNKDDSVGVPFNDFSALVTGIVRDNKDFREILTADYFYDLTGVPKEDDLKTRYFNQENYTIADTQFLDLTKVLSYKPRQKLVLQAHDSSAMQSQKNFDLVTLADHPDPAGVLTTRTFAQRNLSGGTNRRAIEYTFKQMLCSNLAEAADSNASDQFVGRDVERFPAGDHTKYLNTCKSCHTVMDGMRPAFAKLDYVAFNNGSYNTSSSQMHGDFYRNQNLKATVDSYLSQKFYPATSTLIKDLEVNQKNSLFSKTIYQSLINSGSTPDQAEKNVNSILATIRDPKTVDELIPKFNSANPMFLSDLRANKTDKVYIDNFGQTCLNILTDTKLTTSNQEKGFFTCNLDLGAAKIKVLSKFYEAELVKMATPENQKKELVNKLLQVNKQSTNDLGLRYLRALDQALTFPKLDFYNYSTGVANKINKGSYVYGFSVTSDTFVNNANSSLKNEIYGWRGSKAAGGSGVKDFGIMISDSKRFSQCISKKVYENVCGSIDSKSDTNLVMKKFGALFEKENYSLKKLYRTIATDSQCGIIGGQQ